MPDLDITQLIGLVTKGGPAAIILALLYGLSMLVREVRSGKVGDAQKADLNSKIALLEKQVSTLTDSMTRMENELERTLDLVHSMRYQRDQARIRVEFLEQVHNIDPRTVWPPEPQTQGDPAAPPPADPFPGGSPP